jgi:hypothetical protein
MTSSRSSHPPQVQMQEVGADFRSHTNDNHQCTFVLPYQESGINTDYMSTMCEAGHTLQEAPEYVLQHQETRHH